MNIHEYQAKAIFKEFGVPVLKGVVVSNPKDAREAAQELGGSVWVVKAQIHAGGRGKGGGVKIAKSTLEVEELTKNMLGMTLVTHQTGPEGKLVQKVYIEEGAKIKKEYYLGMTLDRSKEQNVMMASTEGGMEIEEVAHNSPDKIIKVAIDPSTGFQGFHGRELAFALGLANEQIPEFIKFAKALYECYTKKEANLVEINPLILTEEGKFLALDAKMGFDDNALSRHHEIEALRDLSEEEPTEIEASRYGLSYVKLDGNVGCMVNGAGLAMGTMDIIKHEGGEPANFLDVGGGASADTVAKGFEIILKDKNVKAIFVNIFGGIVRCDRVANGIIEATKLTNVSVPVIVRLDGTNADEAKEILKNSNIANLIAAENLADGAQKAVKAAKGEFNMSILVGKNSKIIVQGFTGKEGTFHATQCIEYGTNIVGGVTPGKGGQTHLDRPVFNTVRDAVAATGADVSLIFVPPMFVADAIMEAAEAGIKLIVTITEGTPVRDMMIAKPYATKMGAKLIGPNCPGIITPEEAKIGIMPGMIFKKGNVGLISKSGTLTYEASNQIVNEGLGISTAVGIGGDPIIGLSYIELLEMFENDPETKAIAMIGEIGGDLEIQAAKYIKEHVTKPVTAFIAGQSAPAGKRMGHAGAIIAGGAGTAAEKMAALEAAGVRVVRSPADIGKTVKASF